MLGPPQGLGHSGQDLGHPAGVRSLVARFRAPHIMDVLVSVSFEGTVVLGTSANFYLIYMSFKLVN